MNKSIIYTFLQGLLRSYSQIFFSESIWFAISLLMVSFFDISAGLCGLIAVVTTQIVATFLKFDQIAIIKGLYGFNSLLVGLGLGYHYELTLVIIVVAILAGFLTLILTITLKGILGKYYLPYLSLPFVLGFWTVISAGWMINGTETNQSGVYILNTLFSLGGQPLVFLHQWWIAHITSNFFNSYFLSLGAIFFQFNVLAGLVISIALLLFSRIAFLLSLLGYGVAYFAYTYLGMNMTQLGYSHIGFNFILSAIAIGGYFYIPSKYSFIWAIAITPVVALLAAGLFGILKPLNLTLLSLPFNLIIISFIYSLRFRTGEISLKEVQIQEGTPERNLYSYKSFTKRFPNFGWLQIKLPFYGEWHVSQAHNGEHTHKGEWANAWDFVIKNKELNPYGEDGKHLKDYYCYGQNIIAPADGTIVITEDGINDNNIGEVNTLKNWGNTIVIKHAEGLYSKLSHLKKGSITVKTGDNVHFGQVIGRVGNSGRSPYPHLHFQLQATPYIGSKTIKYPLSDYLEEGKEITTFNYPSLGKSVKTIERDIHLQKAFNLMPGTKMNWNVLSPKGEENVTWEVFTSIYNQSYIYCSATKSTASFRNDGVYFYFTHFKGDYQSLLYTFYLAAYRIPLVYIEGNISTDSFPVNQTFKAWRLFLHDFTAPFFQYLKSGFEIIMNRKGSDFDLEYYEYDSNLSGYSFGRLVWKKELYLKVNRDNNLKLKDKRLKIEATCESY